MCRDTHVSLAVKKNTDRMYQLSDRHSYLGGGCVMGSQPRVLTTDVSPPVKDNTERMNQLVR